MMIPGRRIVPTEVIYTPPFPRGGDGMFLRVENIDEEDTTASVTVDVFTRNKEDAWGSTALGTLTITAPGVFELHIPPASMTASTGIREQLRLKVTGATKWMLVRIFPPIFYDAAAVP